jgi:hypothetical protein
MERRKHWGLIPHHIFTPLPIVYKSDYGFSVYPYLDLKLAEEGDVWGIKCGDRLWEMFHASTCSRTEFEEKQEEDMFPFNGTIAPDLPTCEQLEEVFKHKLEFNLTVKILGDYGIPGSYWKHGQYLTSDVKDDENCYMYDMEVGKKVVRSINEEGFIRLCYPAY